MARTRNCRTRLMLDALEDRTLMSVCHVTRLTDSGAGKGFRGDLRYCLDKVNAQPGPDAIDFTVTGTINLNSALPAVSDDLSVNGPGAGQLTVARSPGFDYRILRVTPGVTVGLAGLTLCAGQDILGGGIHNAGTLTLNDVVVTQNNSTSGKGGGIYNTGVLTLNDSIVSSNNAVTTSGATYGGGIYNGLSGILTIHSSVVTNNKATGVSSTWNGSGGGIYSAGALSVFDSTISNNRVDAKPPPSGSSVVRAWGGGIYNLGDMNLESSTISGNSVFAETNSGNGITVVGGGGVGSEGEGTSTINNSTVALNYGEAKSYALGGGVWNNAGTLTITHSTIALNYLIGDDAVQGGGLIAGGVVHVRNSIIAGNTISGGLVYGAYGPDLDCGLSSSGYNLIGNTGGAEPGEFADTDILNVDALLGSLGDNGGPTHTISLRSGSPALDAGDNSDAPPWDQRGDGFMRIVNGVVDIGAFEAQSRSAPESQDFWARLLTADLED